MFNPFYLAVFTVASEGMQAVLDPLFLYPLRTEKNNSIVHVAR